MPDDTRLTRARVFVAIALILIVGVLVSVRRIDERSFGILDGAIVPPAGVLVAGGLTLSPPLLTRLHIYPRDGVELALPQAEDALLRSAE